MIELKSKHKYINCRYCNELVSSLSPICKNCGLEMTSKGVEELAEIEELSIDARNDAIRLNAIGGLCIGYAIIGVILIPETRYVFFLNISYVIVLFYYLFSFLKWNRKYSKIILRTEELAEAKDNKRTSILLVFVSIFINFLFYLFGK